MSWDKVKLGEVCTIEKGNIGIMKAISGEYPLVVLGEERKSHNEYQFDDEAVIIPLVSSTGHGHRSMKRIFFQSGKFSVGSILCAVIPKDKSKLSAEFLYRYLDFNKEKELVSRMRGMANVSLPIKEIASVEIPLPPIDEQKKLISEFQKLETANNQIITELSHQLNLVSQLRQAFLREAMQGKLVPQDEADESAASLLEKIKAEKEKLIAEKKIKRDKPLPEIKVEEIPFEIPSNWIWCRLGEVSEITRGKSPKYSEKGIFKMLNQKCVRWFTIDKSYAKAIDVNWSETIKEDFIVRSGDILVNSTGEGTIGRSAITDSEVDGFIFDSHILKIRSRINQNYICYFINSDFGQNLVESLKGATSTKQTELGVTNLSNFTIPLPPLAEQIRIVEKVEKLMKFCDELETNIRESRSQAESLLQVALKEALEPKEID